MMGALMCGWRFVARAWKSTRQKTTAGNGELLDSRQMEGVWKTKLGFVRFLGCTRLGYTVINSITQFGWERRIVFGFPSSFFLVGDDE
jgi:hypothetical protein